MFLDRVTITGADDSVKPIELIRLSEEFPFVEWGILVSASKAIDFMIGMPRFPSHNWIISTFDNLQFLRTNMKLSLHVCGKWTRDILLGKNNIPKWMLDGFQRVQLNFHAERNSCDVAALFGALSNIKNRQFIFQMDGEFGNRHFESLHKINRESDFIDIVPLFDISGGAGTLPKEWPAPKYRFSQQMLYHGYAGGLGPENLEEQLPLIAKGAGDCRIWIDMETRVRSSDDKIFDLEKCKQVLQICKKYVEEEKA